MCCMKELGLLIDLKIALTWFKALLIILTIGSTTNSYKLIDLTMIF